MAEMSRPGRAGPDAQGEARKDDGLLPKHHRVYLILRQEIEDGVYTDDAPMAGEMSLAERFDVSRITIRKAMDRLTQEGWVERQRGRGTFVRGRGTPSPVGASLSGNIENLVAMGLQTDVALIELTYAPAPAQVCAAMGVAPGTVMQRAVRVRSHEGVPFSHLTTWLPEEIGRSFTAEELQRTPLLRLIERAGHRIASASQAITAKLATPEVAQLLRIEPGEALLSVRRQVEDEQGQVVEYITGLYRPDTYEHQMDYHRSRTPAADIWTTKDTTTGADT